MDEGNLEVSELAGDRVVELRVVDELHGVGLITCKRGEIVQGDEGPVGGVTQVVCHGVIVVVGHQEEGQEEKGEKQGEVEGEVEKLKDNRTSWMVWRWGDKRVKCLEPMWSVMNDQTRNTKDSVQVCSILHVAHVGVRRVTLVIVHNGYEGVEGVLVVKHTFA